MFDRNHHGNGGTELTGVAVLSVPAQAKVLTSVFPGLEPYRESLELGRFVLAEEVPANGESWFLGQVRRMAGAGDVRGLVSFSDPVPRTSSAGQVIKPGHIGTIYQASNAAYLGRATARTLALLPDGTVFSPRAMQKIRSGDRGHAYAEAQLVAHGAAPREPGEGRAVWLAGALDQIQARKLRHPGNHRYAFTLGNRKQRAGVLIGPEPGAFPHQ
jgi:hypothetical protein